MNPETVAITFFIHNMPKSVCTSKSVSDWSSDEYQVLLFSHVTQWSCSVFSATNEKLIGSVSSAVVWTLSQIRTCGRRPSGRLINNQIRFRSGSLKWVICGNEVTAAGMCPALGEGDDGTNRPWYFTVLTHRQQTHQRKQRKFVLSGYNLDVLSLWFKSVFVFVANLRLVWLRFMLQCKKTNDLTLGHFTGCFGSLFIQWGQTCWQQSCQTNLVPVSFGAARTPLLKIKEKQTEILSKVACFK